MDRLMKKLGLLALCTGLSFAVHAVTPQAEAPAEQNVKIDSVVVTGARYASDIRHLPMTVSVVGREKIEQSLQPSLLPTLTEQVPGCSPPHAGSWATACRTAPREASPCAG